MDKNALVKLLVAEFFDLAVDKAKPLAVEAVLAQVDRLLQQRLPKVIANDAADGWTNTHVGDPLNDYPGDAISKRLDNFLFLFGKKLPGRATDFLRDQVSPYITPALRPQCTEATTGAEMAQMVADAIYGEVKSLLEAA